MKRTSTISSCITGALLLVFCMYPQASYADAPQDLNLAYDSGSQTLTVTITHKSSLTGFHRIKTVEIKQNSVVISTTNYETQPGESPFTYTYKVAAAQGDKLEVNATCSLSGSKAAALTVPRASK